MVEYNPKTDYALSEEKLEPYSLEEVAGKTITSLEHVGAPPSGISYLQISFQDGSYLAIQSLREENVIGDCALYDLEGRVDKLLTVYYDGEKFRRREIIIKDYSPD